MNKPKRSKLVLQGETIRLLKSTELDQIVGARDLQSSVERPCMTTFGPGQRCW